MSVREYKSNVFAMLMEVPEYALEVYNALNETEYSDLSMLEIMKLDTGGNSSASPCTPRCARTYENVN